MGLAIRFTISFLKGSIYLKGFLLNKIFQIKSKSIHRCLNFIHKNLDEIVLQNNLNEIYNRAS